MKSLHESRGAANSASTRPAPAPFSHQQPFSLTLESGEDEAVSERHRNEHDLATLAIWIGRGPTRREEIDRAPLGRLLLGAVLGVFDDTSPVVPSLMRAVKADLDVIEGAVSGHYAGDDSISLESVSVVVRRVRAVVDLAEQLSKRGAS